MLDLQTATASDFEAHMQQDFAISVANGVLNLRLAAVERAGSPHPKRLEPFILRFAGAPDLRLLQATYRLTHQELGEMEIFLVQVGADGQGSYYEAIFN